MSLRDFFSGNIVAEDFYRLMVGEQIGEGQGRQVFRCQHAPDLVLKFETTERSFQNVHEWEAWQTLQGSPLERWLAPCVAISPCGTVLLQTRTAPLRPNELKRWKKIPKVFADLKPTNWGILNGRLVCHDYGVMLPTYETALKKLEWIREE